ncbi:hypothetical protein SAMN05445850_6404 [Paraburkholderia tuberum]|uniref:Uncharacterized protein n=1 Tax=Paraburkholderia tuberum TaxID=157910 RepID=A0A1H1K2M2_9BURK|nr:hypothetical protein SAMN05445850_6404 [Paraburkholderia tuberum]
MFAPRAAGMKAIREWWWRTDSLAAKCLRRADSSMLRTRAKCVDVCPYHFVQAVLNDRCTLETAPSAADRRLEW